MFREKEDDRDENKQSQTRYVRYSGAKDKDFWPSEHPTKTTKPAFEDTETRIVAMAGRDVTLPCLVKNLNDKVLLWFPLKSLSYLFLIHLELYNLNGNLPGRVKGAQVR
ncbi:hypothetical protein RUM43_000104 [Polyplax serrata]|uniref:Ig-like domain-containing protein n=1 Tax=Polyplax serrata TaxID=468196 RepID=A0AAN8XPT1_POLSC